MIKVLSQKLINQIAAGEVIERPASVIKELVENSIDAGATEVNIKIFDAGKSLISISDNGCGMDKDSLLLCVLSHATSKLTDENLFDIHTFGFRGEALASMVSIARVSIISSDNEDGEAWVLDSEGKENQNISIATRKKGTTISVKDLFFATPARLKFLKSDSTENEACIQTINKIALSFPSVSFNFFEGDKKKFFYPATDNLGERIKDIFGENFAENIFEINEQNENYSLHGFIGVPTFNKSSSSHQYFFVNHRFVKDKIFALALKSAYSGLTPTGRFPVAILFLDMPYDEVDVNAHPAKTEIRFKEVEKVRNFLIRTLKKILSSYGGAISSTEITNNFMNKNSENNLSYLSDSFHSVYHAGGNLSDQNSKNNFKDNFDFKHENNFSKFNYENKSNKNFSSGISRIKNYQAPIFQPHKINTSLNNSENEIEKSNFEKTEENNLNENPVCVNEINLGTALYQIANTYIIAAYEDNLIIVDQHAAAERITLEKLKKNIKLDSQDLLLPEVCFLSEAQIELFEKNSDLIAKFGIVYEKLSNDEIMVRALPSILGNCEARPLINDIANELENLGNIYSLEEKIHLILSTISCHGSLRAGKKLSQEEMNSLLRRMEQTENIAQCCHGRPSYVLISTKNLNKFFERT